MDLLPSVALAGGMAWASGLRLYAAVLAAGLLGRFGYLQLPETLRILENPWILGLSAALFFIEFLADKIPAVDSAWDSIQAFIRIPAGAVLAALLLGGTLTAGTQAAKSGSRALINTSPEPFSNITASLGEDALVAVGLWSAIKYPLLFMIALGLFILFLFWFLPRIFRGVRAVWAVLSGRRSTGPSR